MNVGITQVEAVATLNAEADIDGVLADDEAEEPTTGPKTHKRTTARARNNIKITMPPTGCQFRLMEFDKSATVTVPHRPPAEPTAATVETETDVDIISGFKACETKV